jgi:hypothetical protein
MQKICLSISVFLVICASAYAQTNTGAIVGTVTDTSKAVVPKVKVTVKNMDTNLTVETTTDDSGNFVVTPLLVGRYSVSAEAPGFKAEVRPGVTVDVQSRVRADFVLQVGAVAETVEVHATNPLLQTDSSYVGQVMDTERIDDLPLNGRYLTRLAVLAPGATPETTGSKDAPTGGFSVNGLRPYQNTYLLDGVDNDNRQAGLTGGVDYVIGPPPDAVGEFKLQTNNMSAEFGTSAGAVMNVTIKSGTNRLHGDLFEFVRNSDFDAKNFFDSPTAPIPPYRLNQFGGPGSSMSSVRRIRTTTLPSRSLTMPRTGTSTNRHNSASREFLLRRRPGRMVELPRFSCREFPALATAGRNRLSTALPFSNLLTSSAWSGGRTPSRSERNFTHA